MTWVKICGTTNLHDAQLCVAAGANAVGFIFAPSPRQIEPATAAEVVCELRGEIESIGVFVNQTPERVAEIARSMALAGVQLHGEEPARSLPEVRRLLGDRKVIKTLSAPGLQNGEIDLAAYLLERESMDAILLDSGQPQQRGGTGTSFDWEAIRPIAEQIRRRVPLIIAGGLNSDNVAHAIELFQPWGVDVASGVESSAGLRDEAKLRDFVAAVRRVPASARPRE
jgi:phosphoribosylanthranilate isomerase